MALPRALKQLADSLVAAVASIDPGPIAVALSGGPDSAVAAWACVQARRVGSVRAIHIDHGWDASSQLCKAAQAIADQLGLHLDVVTISSPPGPSPEAIARAERLKALLATAGRARVVTGHHADDSAETMLLNLFRGAGLTGLAGIPVERGSFIRPLLPFRRAGLRELADELGLPFIDDPANSDVAFRRNLIRHRVLPELAEQLDDDVVERLGRAAVHLAAADSYLHEITPVLPVRKDDGALLVPVAPLVTAPEVLAARMVRAVLREVNPPYPGTSREVRAILEVARGSAMRFDLNSGWVAEEEGPFVAIHRPVVDSPPAPVRLSLPGSVVFGKHSMSATVVGDGRTTHLSHDRVRIAVADDLEIRTLLPGDRIEIAGGTKSVSDALGEAGIPRRKRSAWPVIESRARIAWIPGVRVATWAREHSVHDTWVELERRSA
jgi:tRNA(Ile)-lysidine synthase